MDFYKTLGGGSEGIYKEKGSKFLAFASPAGSVQEVKEQLEALKKTCYDARHHCYAYVLGPCADKYKAHDDGEPNHSAGDPILGQIRSRQLTNTSVVVVRYFGGTKLGVSGLVSAYKTAAADALDRATVVEVPIRDSISLAFPYHKTSDVMRLLKEFDVAITLQQFLEKCYVTGEIKTGMGKQLTEKLALCGVGEVRVILSTE